MNRVFVYGTLKRGQRNFHYLDGARYLGAHTTEKRYSMYLFDDYPAVCLEGEQAIRGEVFEIDDARFRGLDRLEWYPEYYQRVEIETRYGSAWMYFVAAELCRGRPMLSGNWS